MSSMNYRFFSQSDFDRCRPACSIEDMDPVFMRKLDKAREYSGIPYVVTSAARSHAHELSRGRNGDSEHVHDKGRLAEGIDVAAVGSRQRFLIVRGLIKAGFDRIGINYEKNFIHVGGRPGKDKEVLFPY